MKTKELKKLMKEWKKRPGEMSLVIKGTNLGDKMQPCPYKYKYELVRWACDNTKWSTSVINKLTRMQLYAIWFKRGANNGK